MAEFYLNKKDKSNLITDRIQLSQSLYRSATDYYNASKMLCCNLNYFLVALTNVAFSCELYLKAMLIGFDKDYCDKCEFTDPHNIEYLFRGLPKSEQKYISDNISLTEKAEFDLLLHENGNAFVVYRYACERNDICGHTDFLFAFADILKFAYESLSKENNILIN